MAQEQQRLQTILDNISEQNYRGLLATAQRQAQELALLDQVTTTLARQIDLHTTLHTLVEALAHSFGYPLVSIYLRHGDDMVMTEQYGYINLPPVIPLSKGIIGKVTRTGIPIFLEDVTLAPEFISVDDTISSEICVPLRRKGEVVGVLNVESNQQPGLTEKDLRLLNTLSEHISIALNRANLYAELSASEERFRKIFEEGPFGMALFDPQYRYHKVNPALCQLLDYTQEELLQHTVIDVTYPADRPSDLENFVRMFQGDLMCYQTQKRYVRKNGELRWASLTSSLISGGNGQPMFGLSIVEDITQRKQMEAAEQEQRRLADGLQKTASMLNQTLQLDQVLSYILTNLGQVVPHDAASILLVEGSEAVVALTSGNSTTPVGLRMVIANTSLLKSMAATGHCQIIADTLFSPELTSPIWGYGRSWAIAPLQAQGQILGFLHLSSEQPHFFNPEHLRWLQAYSQQAASALENARLFREMQLFARHMAILNNISHMSNQAPNLEFMLQRLIPMLLELVNVDHVFMTLWDEDSQRPLPVPTGHRERLDPADELVLARAVLKLGNLLVAEDINKSPEIPPGSLSHSVPRSILGLPLIADGKKLGVAFIGYDARHKFKQDELNLGQQAASQISLAISKAQSLEAERQRTQQLARANAFILALGQVAMRVEGAPDPNDVMETLGRELQKVNVHCMVALPPDDDRNLVVHYLSLSPKFIQKVNRIVKMPVENYRFLTELFPYYEEVVLNRQAVFSDCLPPLMGKALPQLPERLLKLILPQFSISDTTRGIFLPLLAGDEFLGTLWMWGEDLEESDLPAASVFASQVAVALENARLYSQVHNLAVTDQLTGLFNRRALFKLGQKEVDQALRTQRTLSVIMLDIDHFKRVNDEYSHTMGDLVLQSLGQQMQAMIRSVDIVARYGGEEFILLLPETTLQEAVQVAERLRVSVDELQIGSACIQITVSIGVAELLPSEIDLAQVIERADQALYTAKSAGRNCVIARTH